MTSEEHKQHLDYVKHNLTNRERISLVKEYNKLPKSYNYWNKRRNNLMGYSEDDYIFGHYCDNKISYVTQRMENLEYILDIPEKHTFMYNFLTVN